jgi:hypothetical protein
VHQTLDNVERVEHGRGAHLGFQNKGDNERRSLTMRVKALALGVPVNTIEANDLTAP